MKPATANEQRYNLNRPQPCIMCGQHRCRHLGNEESPGRLLRTCDEILTDAVGRSARCRIPFGVEHSHVDYSFKEQIKLGRARMANAGNPEDVQALAEHWLSLDPVAREEAMRRTEKYYYALSVVVKQRLELLVKERTEKVNWFFVLAIVLFLASLCGLAALLRVWTTPKVGSGSQDRVATPPAHAATYPGRQPEPPQREGQ